MMHFLQWVNLSKRTPNYVHCIFIQARKQKILTIAKNMNNACDEVHNFLQAYEK